MAQATSRPTYAFVCLYLYPLRLAWRSWPSASITASGHRRNSPLTGVASRCEARALPLRVGCVSLLTYTPPTTRFARHIHSHTAPLLNGTSNATSPCVPGCYCSQPDVYQCDSDSSPGLTMTYVRGFDTDTDERVVRAFDTWGDTFTNNRTKWRSFPRGWPVNMTVRECTPPHPSATCALQSQSYIQRHSSRSTSHTQDGPCNRPGYTPQG